MKRLVYTLERMQPEQVVDFLHPLAQDAIVGLTMAGLGLPGIQRRVDAGSVTDLLDAVVTFPDDNSMRRFNLRIERALAVRNVKIRKIHVVEEFGRRRSDQQQRAVA